MVTLDQGKLLKDAKISLAKTIEKLDNGSKLLSSHKARVVLVMDYSGSMSSLYHQGTVQNTLTRIAPLALQFDDNGELDVFKFSNSAKEIIPLDINNYSNYVRNHMMTGSMGGTEYIPPLNLILKKYFPLFGGSKLPVYVIFITDGESSDSQEAVAVINKLIKKKTYIKFIGIGNSSFRGLDAITDRFPDCTSKLYISNLDSYSDDELYNNLLLDYSEWVKVNGVK